MTTFCLIIFVGSILARVALALDSSEVNNYARQVADTDPSVRLSAMKNLSDELGKLANGAPGGAGNDVIPILAKALSDPAALMRQGAAGDLVVIALNMNSRFRKLNPALPDPRSYPPLRAPLEKAMFDPDPEVRRAATGAYA